MGVGLFLVSNSGVGSKGSRKDEIMTITNIHEYNKKDKAWKLVFAFWCDIFLDLVFGGVCSRLVQIKWRGGGGADNLENVTLASLWLLVDWRLQCGQDCLVKHVFQAFLRQCRALDVFDCFEVFGESFALFNRNWFLFVLCQFLARAIIIP